jgi:hypothetical protein
MRRLGVKRGKSLAEAAEAARKFSGHSWRSGYATSAADADIPSLRIQKHCRHASADQTAKYVRSSQAWTKSGLKGILHRAAAGPEFALLAEHFQRATSDEQARLLEALAAVLAKGPAATGTAAEVAS